MPWKRAMKLLNSDTMNAATLADATAEQAFGTDQVLLVPSRFASGWK